MKSSSRTLCLLGPASILLTTVIVSGCAQETRIAAVPKSNPYSFITWSPDDTPETIEQVRRHNAKHRVMKNQTGRNGAFNTKSALTTNEKRSSHDGYSIHTIEPN